MAAVHFNFFLALMSCTGIVLFLHDYVPIDGQDQLNFDTRNKFVIILIRTILGKNLSVRVVSSDHEHVDQGSNRSSNVGHDPWDPKEIIIRLSKGKFGAFIKESWHDRK